MVEEEELAGIAERREKAVRRFEMRGLGNIEGKGGRKSGDEGERKYQEGEQRKRIFDVL